MAKKQSRNPSTAHLFGLLSQAAEEGWLEEFAEGIIEMLESSDENDEDDEENEDNEEENDEENDDEDNLLPQLGTASRIDGL